MKRFKLISSLALCITLISCSSNLNLDTNINKDQIISTSNQKIVKSFDIDAGKASNIKTNNNVKVKIKFPSGFNTKYVNKKTIKDIKSIQIWLTTNTTNPLTNMISGTDFKFDVNPDAQYNYDLEYEFNFKNIASPISQSIYAAAQAYSLPKADGNWATSNITNSATEISAVSTSSVMMDSSYALTFTPSSPTSLDVNIKLIDAKKSIPSSPEQIYNTPNTVGSRSWDMSVDNAGNGLVAWKEDTGATRKIKYAKITDFLPPNVNPALPPPAIEPNEYTVTTATLIQTSVSVNNKGNGFIFYSGYDVGSAGIQIFAIPVYNYVPKTTAQINISNLPGGKNIYEMDSEILQNGDALVVFTTDYLFTSGVSKNIFGIKLNNDGKTVTNSNAQLFYASPDAKTNPKIALNEMANGVLTWDEQFGGSNYDIFAMTLKGLDVPEILNGGAESIAGTTGTSTLTGTSTYFRPQLTSGSRIIDGNNIYTVASVTDDFTAILTGNIGGPSFGPTAPFKGKAIAKTLSGTIDVTSGQSNATGTTASFDTEVKVGERVKIFEPVGGTFEYLVVSAIGGPNNISFLRNPGTTCNGCKVLKKGDFMLTNDITNTINGRYPNVQVNSEMKAFIVWKENTATHSIQGRTFEPLAPTPLGGMQTVGDATTLDTTSILDGEDNSPPALSLNSLGKGQVLWTMKDGSSNRNVYRQDIINYSPYSGTGNLLFTSTSTKPYSFPLLKTQIEPNATPPFYASTNANAIYLFFKRDTIAPNEEYIELLNIESTP
jgi:hypothetical protein